jgi:hypothetical protein
MPAMQAGADHIPAGWKRPRDAGRGVAILIVVGVVGFSQGAASRRAKRHGEEQCRGDTPTLTH